MEVCKRVNFENLILPVKSVIPPFQRATITEEKVGLIGLNEFVSAIV